MKTCKHCGCVETLKNRRICRACQAKYMREYNARNLDKHRRNKRAYYHLAMKDPEKKSINRVRTRDYWRNLRDEVIATYGGKCVCCGETEPMFLTLDHVNNDGADHRRSLGAKEGNGRGGNSRTLAWAKKNGYPNTLQVLCMNCNLGKARNNGACPHHEKHHRIQSTGDVQP